MFGCFFSIYQLKEVYRKIYTVFNNLDTKYISFFYNHLGMKTEIYNKEIIVPLSKVCFEGSRYYARETGIFF